MQTKITVKDGQMIIDAIDGVGEECREKHKPFLDRLAARFNDIASTEEPKPEMAHTEQAKEAAAQ